jgi:hypothetical protein
MKTKGAREMKTPKTAEEEEEYFLAAEALAADVLRMTERRLLQHRDMTRATKTQDLSNMNATRLTTEHAHTQIADLLSSYSVARILAEMALICREFPAIPDDRPEWEGEANILAVAACLAAGDSEHFVILDTLNV